MITNVHKTLSSGIPLAEARKNLTENLAEGTDAPIGDNSSIPSNMSRKVEDLKATTGKSVFTIF